MAVPRSLTSLPTKTLPSPIDGPELAQARSRPLAGLGRRTGPKHWTEELVFETLCIATGTRSIAASETSPRQYGRN